MMQQKYHPDRSQRRYLPIKRVLGAALAAAGMIVLSPAFVVITVAIKAEEGLCAPVFFKQQRVGRGGKLFTLYKFRSMRLDAPHEMPTHLLASPDRYITRVGAFLRRTSLDELPQLWNILRGDMAVVGPRPALWNQDDLIEARAAQGIDALRPGLTGWAQINGRDELAIADKVALDSEYLQRLSFAMDVRCFVGTFSKVVRGDGVSEGGPREGKA